LFFFHLCFCLTSVWISRLGHPTLCSHPTCQISTMPQAGGGEPGCPCSRPELLNNPTTGTGTNDFRTECPAGFGGGSTGWGGDDAASWSYCLKATVGVNDGVADVKPYQPTYGAQCEKHYESGSSSCFDVPNGVELPPTGDPARSSWCNRYWSTSTHATAMLRCKTLFILATMQSRTRTSLAKMRMNFHQQWKEAQQLRNVPPAATSMIVLLVAHRQPSSLQWRLLL